MRDLLKKKSGNQNLAYEISFKMEPYNTAKKRYQDALACNLERIGNRIMAIEHINNNRDRDDYGLGIYKNDLKEYKELLDSKTSKCTNRRALKKNADDIASRISHLVDIILKYGRVNDKIMEEENKFAESQKRKIEALKKELGKEKKSSGENSVEGCKKMLDYYMSKLEEGLKDGLLENVQEDLEKIGQVQRMYACLN